MTNETKTETEAPITLDLPTEAPANNLPAAVEQDNAKGAGGLTYATANAEEKAQIEEIINSIDLTQPDSVTSIGGKERQSLAAVSRELLDSFDPSIKIAFAEAFAALFEQLKENSLDNIKKRSTYGLFKKAIKTLIYAITGKDYRVELSKGMLKNFMKDVTGSRTTIEEVADKLEEQKGRLKQNWTRINIKGANIHKAAQSMRIVRAATAEYVRRVNDGEITQLKELEAKHAASGRADDLDTLQMAQALWDNIRVIDGDLLGSISTYDMQVANLAFTRRANITNRIKTETALTSTVSEWLTQLGTFAIVLEERAAQVLLSGVAELNEKAAEANHDIFEELVDAHVKGVAQGMYSLKDQVRRQNEMKATLEKVGPAVAAEFNQLAEDIKSLEVANAAFQESAAKVYENPATLAGQAAPTAQP